MNSKNICKFITETNPDRLEVHQFIYESDEDIIKTEVKLLSNRAILIKCGNGSIIIDGKEWSFSAGSLIFVFTGEKIVINQSEKCEYMYIDFSGMRADTLFARFGISRLVRLYSNFDGLIPFWYDSLCRASEINLDLVSEGILLYTFSRLIKHTDEKNTLINKILDITEKNFTDSSISISAIADELSYNTKYISHTFKEKMGISYSEYLRNIRIKYAVSLLEYGIDSIKNIAFLSGFSDPLYFSSVFKKSVGISPKEYISRKK